jgi:pyruvate kinase
MFTKDHKKVKIVATIGPASDSFDTLVKLAENGVNVFRLNLSHKNREEMVSNVATMRKVEKTVGWPLTIMGDLGGPKIRTGAFDKEYTVAPGDKIEIVREQITGNDKRFSLNFPSIVSSLEPGAEVYLNDGIPKLEVIKKTKDGVLAKFMVGGIIKSRMGFMAQGLVLGKFALTEKDKHDAKVMIELGADALAISFVQTGKDVESVKKLLPKTGKRPMIVTKIETAASLVNIEDIIKASDAIMVARGDLGYAVPIAEVPHLQKKLINAALRHSKPVITATQMLDSMTNSLLPTRAEVTDVANAILDGTDAVMLSGETARGQYPVDVVAMMSKIIKTSAHQVQPREFREDDKIIDAVTASTVKIADQVKARLIIVFTHNGPTARRISRHRHSQVIIALSPNQDTVHNLNFTWGVAPYLVKQIKSFDEFVVEARKIALNNPIIKLKKGEPFVVSAGVPFGHTGATNMVLVERV